MQNVLKAFGFGESIRKWIEVFYCDIKSSVMVNGCASKWFSINRGCRQGDPISPYIFVLCVEILAIMIRENHNIKGIIINNTEHKISQYADDTEFTLAGDRESFETCINVLDRFGKVSGLYVNTEKTGAMWLGSTKNSTVTFMQNLKIIWNPIKMKVLGIWITNTLKECSKLNYDEKFYEVRKLMQVWLKRNLTPLGRVAVLKSLILSKLIHLWLLLPRPPENIINEMQKMCYQFVWGNKPDKINRKTAVKSVSNGGIGIPDLKMLISALKLTWIRKYKSSQHKWKSVINDDFEYFDRIDMYGPEIVNKYVGRNNFWTEVFCSYKDFFYKVRMKKVEEILTEPILFNKRILVGKKTINKEQWSLRGVCCSADFLHDNGEFYSVDEFNTKYGLQVDFITYMGCILSIKNYLKLFNFNFINNRHLLMSVQMNKLYAVVKGSKEYYNVLIKDNNEPKCIKKMAVKT
jgi:hypothetical protein